MPESDKVLGAQLRQFLLGLLDPAERIDAGSDQQMRARRADPRRVPGSRHFASVLAYGDFILREGPSIRCEAIPGISGVVTSTDLQTSKDGRPRVRLERILTHFHFTDPAVLIEQSFSRPSVGELTGASAGGSEALLPGKASFSQFLVLSLAGHPLANRDPLVMTAERVDQWPPIGSTFVSEKPTDFFDLADLEKPQAKPFATLAACKAVTVDEIRMPQQ